MIIEEALEGADTSLVPNPKTYSRDICKDIFITPISDVDRLDKACDQIIIAIGSMAKLGLNPRQIAEALNAVNQANMTKLHNKSVDALGKLNKPINYVGPEIKLEEILNKRTN